jgi:hypothetical protein
MTVENRGSITRVLNLQADIGEECWVVYNKTQYLYYYQFR